MRRRSIIGALLLITVGVVLGTTVFREDIAQATGLAQSVTVANSPGNPVPVREQALDGSGNLKVHEQGTADVHVTNSSLTVAADASVTDGGSGVTMPATTYEHFVTFPTATASAITIHLSAGVELVELVDDGIGTPAFFYGPADGGSADVALSLNRPVEFSAVGCKGPITDTCTVSWVGNSP